MGETTGISWCDHTFNPWIGCAKVAPECAHCYAQTYGNRFGVEWGANEGRRRTSASNWRDPLKWDKAAKRDGVRRRVFCASLADVFDDHADLGGWREELFQLIERCSNLDWLLLTKRPENMRRMAPESWRERWPSHVWAGTSAGTQRTADRAIPLLLQVPAAVRFVSCEPLLGPIDFRGWGNDAPRVDPSAPYKWANYQWEEWIPQELRTLVEDFWQESWGRGPAAWLRDHAVQMVPRTGARVTLNSDRDGGWLTTDKMASSGTTGRYVHMWNNIGRVVADDGTVHCTAGGHGSGWFSHWLQSDGSYRSEIDWVIVGGESGHNARPCNVEWIRSIVRQCKAAGVPAFVKQLGAKHVTEQGFCLSDRGAGADPAEWPEDLRIREYPNVL
jgi:protein gp37